MIISFLSSNIFPHLIVFCTLFGSPLTIEILNWVLLCLVLVLLWEQYFIDGQCCGCQKKMTSPHFVGVYLYFSVYRVSRLSNLGTRHTLSFHGQLEKQIIIICNLNAKWKWNGTLKQYSEVLLIKYDII